MYMELIEWSDSLSVNDKELDEQHKKILDAINELHEALIKGKSSEIIDKTLDDLFQYSINHFAAEEKLFEKIDYPGVEAHIEKHNQFSAKVLEFKEGLKRGKMTLSMDVMEYLISWFIGHIQRVDQEYAKIIKPTNKESS